MAHLFNRAMLFASIFLAIACRTSHPVDAPTPEGFAPFMASKQKRESGRTVTRAVSGSGVVYRVRLESHDPKAALSFWQEALSRKLTEEGYLVLESRAADVAGRAGSMLDAVAAQSEGDYGFLVAFAMLDDDLLIVESAGKRVELDRAKPEILKAIGSIAIKQR